MTTARETLIHEHLQRLWACRRCPTVAGTPVTGPAPGSRILLVGQAPGPKEENERRPFAYTAGRRLFEWFARLGVDEAAFRERIWITSSIRCFPGRQTTGTGDRPPFPEEIERCSAWLDEEIGLLQPRLVVAVGGIGASLFVTGGTLTELVGPVHRGERAGRTLDVVVLPHPSGRSTWLNREENRERLDRALQSIASHREFVRTFTTPDRRPPEERSPRVTRPRNRRSPPTDD